MEEKFTRVEFPALSGRRNMTIRGHLGYDAAKLEATEHYQRQLEEIEFVLAEIERGNVRIIHHYGFPSDGDEKEIQQ